MIVQYSKLLPLALQFNVIWRQQLVIIATPIFNLGIYVNAPSNRFRTICVTQIVKATILRAYDSQYYWVGPIQCNDVAKKFMDHLILLWSLSLFCRYPIIFMKNVFTYLHKTFGLFGMKIIYQVSVLEVQLNDPILLKY